MVSFVVLDPKTEREVMVTLIAARGLAAGTVVVLVQRVTEPVNANFELPLSTREWKLMDLQSHKTEQMRERCTFTDTEACISYNHGLYKICTDS